MKKILSIAGHGKFNGLALYLNKGKYFISNEYGTRKITTKQALKLINENKGAFKMTYQELKEKLSESMLFTDAEAHHIIRTCGKYTIGNVIVACEIAGIELTGDDIDALIAV